MARETVPERRARGLRIFDRLNQAMPDAKIELDYQTPLQLVTAVILSAQCTDKRVNMVTPALFERYPDARSLADAHTAELEKMIHSCGFFRAKAKALKGMAGAVAVQHGGEVPTARAELAALPGVGPKTAGVVTVHLGGEPAFPVDTHVKRLARRLGFTKQEEPSRVEEESPGAGAPGAVGQGAPAAHLARTTDVLRAIAGLRAVRGARALSADRGGEGEGNGGEGRATAKACCGGPSAPEASGRGEGLVALTSPPRSHGRAGRSPHDRSRTLLCLTA